MPVSAETIDIAIATPADGPSFGVAPSGTWTWMSFIENTVGLIPNWTARDWTYDFAA